jgi:hypothetical protein
MLEPEAGCACGACLQKHTQAVLPALLLHLLGTCRCGC